MAAKLSTATARTSSLNQRWRAERIVRACRMRRPHYTPGGQKIKLGTPSSIRWNYLDSVFTYAGTASLSLEMEEKEVSDIASGDVFIQGGYPGHAVIVVEKAKMSGSNATVFLLAQSYMPAQEMHILRNPSDAALSPWYSTEFGEKLVTPEWTFSREQLKQFR